MSFDKVITLALVDDHKLFRKGLISLVKTLNINCSILFEASNGEELECMINPNNIPDIILLDVNMPKRDGFQTVIWLHEQLSKGENIGPKYGM